MISWGSFALGFSFGALLMLVVWLHIAGRALRSWTKDLREYNALLTYLFEPDPTKSSAALKAYRDLAYGEPVT